MAATEPQQLVELFAEYFNSGDLEGLATLYEEEVVFVRMDGETVRGKPNVLQFIGQVAGTGRYAATDSVVHAAGDVALLLIKWSIERPSETMNGSSTDVARRQPDRTWKFIIDNPWGSAVLAP
jgi:ketosteroid isomerase-like protein